MARKVSVQEEVTMLEALYMLDVDEPSDQWTEAARSKFSPEVETAVDRYLDSYRRMSNLTFVIAVELLVLVSVLAWGLWKVFHG